MGLLITDRLYRRDDDGDFFIDDVDIILHKLAGGDGSLEIVGFDMETAIGAQALGIDDYDGELNRYRSYKEEGLSFYLRSMPQDLEAAFEDQGYDVFSDEEFTREQFLNAVGQNLRDNVGPISDNIELLIDAVATHEYDKSELIEDLIEGLKTYSEKESIDQEGTTIRLFLYQLVDMLPEETFVFSKYEPMYEHSHVDMSDMRLGYDITINDEHIVSWSRDFSITIEDPITFTTQLEEYQYDRDEAFPHEVMSFMGWSYPSLPDDYEEPDHPESDEDGRFGVQYLKHGREVAIISYKTLVEASFAAELSTELFEQRGEQDDYDIVFLERVGGSNWFPLKERD